MNYDDAIQQIIDVLKADKSVVQPWRNYALKHLQESIADARMGKTTTNRQAPDDLPTMEFEKPRPLACVCTAGMPPRRDCPVHRVL